MVKPVYGDHVHMAVVVDIPCPECGEAQSVRKRGIGQYACDECGATFDATEVEP